MMLQLSTLLWFTFNDNQSWKFLYEIWRKFWQKKSEWPDSYIIWHQQNKIVLLKSTLKTLNNQFTTKVMRTVIGICITRCTRGQKWIIFFSEAHNFLKPHKCNSWKNSANNNGPKRQRFSCHHLKILAQQATCSLETDQHSLKLTAASHRIITAQQFILFFTPGTKNRIEYLYSKEARFILLNPLHNRPTQRSTSKTVQTEIISSNSAGTRNNWYTLTPGIAQQDSPQCLTYRSHISSPFLSWKARYRNVQ